MVGGAEEEREGKEREDRGARDRCIQGGTEGGRMGGRMGEGRSQYGVASKQGQCKVARKYTQHY